jgi:FixJ family two-component response regulator
MQIKKEFTTVSVIDKDIHFVHFVEMSLHHQKISVVPVRGNQALASEDLKQSGCLLISLSYPQTLRCYQQWLNQGITCPVIILLEDDNIPLAVSALKQGAFDVLVKPIHEHQLRTVVQRALGLSSLLHPPRVLTQEREAKPRPMRLTDVLDSYPSYALPCKRPINLLECAL